MVQIVTRRVHGLCADLERRRERIHLTVTQHPYSRRARQARCMLGDRSVPNGRIILNCKVEKHDYMRAKGLNAATSLLFHTAVQRRDLRRGRGLLVLDQID